jgi:hypothetical protein
MVPLIILSAVIGLPILLALILRVNAIMLFMSVAAGAMLQRALGDSLSLTLSMAIRDAPTAMIANITLLSLPVLLTIIILRKTMSPAGALLQIIPLIATGAAFGALMVPLLPIELQNQVYQVEYGAVVKQSQDVAVGAAVVFNMLLAWRMLRRHEDSKHGHHH